MITKDEKRLANTNYLHKDFYQLYPEAIEYIQKSTNRWDPSATNESDPMIVILKYLVSVADKQSYISDQALLQNFMPSVTEEGNMRKICEQLGYEMKYYQSATTQVSFMYTGTELSESGDSDKYIQFDAFTTVLTNEDEDVSFVLTEPVYIHKKNSTYTVNAIEGTYCNAYEGGLVVTSNLDDNNRFYLPEASIAENGIFIYREGDDSNKTWKRVSNLNTQTLGTKCYKFGYDSSRKLPYIQFPNDIADIIGEGLNIHYIRTNGVNGNIGAQTLTVLKSETYSQKEGAIALQTEEGEDALVISNVSSATNGRDPETIDEAYASYKKTIGTFDTLVTCRDYANAIYNLLSQSDNTTPLVSNVIVSDIRDNLTRSRSMVTYTDYGVAYKDIANKDAEGKDLINHFDLMMYPFTPIKGGYTLDSYKESFKYNKGNASTILSEIEDFKTLSHNIKLPDIGEVVCLKNYYGLKGNITTNYRVNKTEQASILSNIYRALYENFNMRKVDIGEPISIDDIIEVVKSADSRIKYVNIDIDSIDTRVHVNSDTKDNEYTLDEKRDIYIDLVSKNVMGGNIPLFKYDERFNFDYGQKLAVGKKEGADVGYPDAIYGNNEDPDKRFTTCDTEVRISSNHELKENEIVQFIAPNFRTKLTYPAYVNYFFQSCNPIKKDPVPAQMVDLYSDYYRGLLTRVVFGEGSSETVTIDASNYARIDKVLPLYRMYTTDSTRTNGGYLVDGSGGIYKRMITFVSTGSYWTPQPITTQGEALTFTSITITNEVDFIRKLSIYGYIYKKEGGKYKPVNSYDSTIPTYYYATTSHIKVNPDGSTVNYEGEDGEVAGIGANTEYKLKEGDILYINYTDSNDNVFNIKYTHNKIYINNIDEEDVPQGIIIKPNFDLKDSKYEHDTDKRSWAKESEIHPDLKDLGMFSLSTSEQIDLRDYVKTTLCTPTKCYWIIKNGTIPFDTNGNYILDENEYFFYTNDDMTELVTLGSGTKLHKEGEFIFSIDYGKSKVDLDDVASNGLAAFADNPWVTFKFSTNGYLELQEMQFITLTQNDALNDIDLEDKEEEPVITNDWKKVEYASFTFSGSSQEILPTLVTGDKWEIRSRLDLNVGPEINQKLRDNQSIILHYRDEELEPLVLKPFETDHEIIYPTFSCNYLLQKAGGNGIDISVKKYVVATGSEEYTDDFTICVFEDVGSTIEYRSQEGAPVTLSTNDIDNNFTKISFAKCKEATFNVIVPEKSFGIVMIYYSKIGQKAIANVPSLNSTYELSQYNADKKSDPEGRTFTYPLHEGLNTIKISKSDTLILKGNDDNEGSVVISKIKIVNNELDNEGVYNSLLDLRGKEESDKLLETIKNITQDSDGYDRFFYSCPIDNSSVININVDAGETLATPEIWYDTNNLCNKFIVSELDADKFESQIIIEKTSRL